MTIEPYDFRQADRMQSAMPFHGTKVTYVPSIVLIGLIVVISGCSITTRVELLNNTGKTIRVCSGYEQRTQTTIKAGGIGIVPHTVGSFTIKPGEGAQWIYGELNVPAVAARSPYCRDSRRWLFAPALILRLVVEADGKVYEWSAAQKSRTISSYEHLNFPLVPYRKGIEP